jgi:hypothetical protein
MKVDIDEDTVEVIVAASVRKQIDDLLDYIDMREHGSLQSVMYSTDVKEDIKQVNKLIKGLKTTYNFYAVPGNRI